jgi:hypothetical protein
MSGFDDDAKAAEELVFAIRPLLAGKPAQVQGAALVELVAMFIAGHIAPGSFQATEIARNEVLGHFVETVRELIPFSK